MHADDEDGVIQGDSGSDDHSEPPSQYSRQSRRKNIFSKLQRRGKEAELSKSPNAGLRQEASQPEEEKKKAPNRNLFKKIKK